LGHARDIAARPVEPGDQAEPNWITAYFENDWNGRSRCLGYNCGWSSGSDNHCHLTKYQIGRQREQALVLIISEAIFNRDILAFDKACPSNLGETRSRGAEYRQAL